MSTKISNYAMVAAVTLFIFVMGVTIGQNISSLSVNNQAGFQAGWSAAKDRLSQTSQFNKIPANVEIRNLTGRVLAIKSNSISLATKPIEPLADPNLDQRIVAFDNNTSFLAMVKRDEKTYQAEMKAYEASQKKTPENNNLIYPSLFEQKKITSAEIKVGDRIIVASAKDIRDSKKFLVESIFIINETENLGTTTPIK